MWSTCVVTIFAALLVLPNSASAQDGVSCVNPRGKKGDCRNIKTCEPLMNLLSEFRNQVAEFLRQSVCGFEGPDPLVCCPIIENNNGTKNRNNNGNENGNNNDNNNGENNGNSNTENNGARGSKYGPLLAPVCGTIDAKYTRVVGGVPAKLGAWPWMAVLGFTSKQNPNKPRWLCGGSLISARHVLTAAHCVHTRNDLFLVRLGEHDLEDDNEGATPIDLGIEKRTIHPNYSSTTYVNDVAVLRLQQDVEFTPLIKPLCLPVTDTIKNKNLEGSFPFVAGWGSVYFNGPSSSVLQQVQLPVVNASQCQAAFKKFKSAVIDDRVLCAGYTRGGKDSCKGDSGGPLMHPVGKTFYAVGVVSFGYKCAEAGYPGIYTKITRFLDFIIPLLN